MIKKDNEAYKTIGEVAEIVNLINPKNGSLSTHTLRFWEKEFKQIKPKILAGNRRYYDNDTIEIIKKVKFLLKEKGMTIQGVKKYLAEGQSELDENSKLTINTTKNLLKSKLNKISKIVKELKK
jgi:DNA-binding transcriptional MerR regulator|tara:strand:- start:907 stop:1278 length:372 start_codon:yes stop_codon:yes gene_type:complete